MWKSLIFGCALLALGGVAQAEMTARHNFVAFETVESALEGAKADELVRLTGHIVSEPSLNFAQGYLQKKKLVFTGNKGQNLPDFGLYYLNFSKNTYFRCNSPLPPRLTTSRGRSA